MELYFEIAGNQINGARDYQEDAFMVTHLGEGEESNAASLVIMADGMGGHAAGNVASNMATSTFNKTFSSQYPTDDIPEALKQSLLAANDTIHSAVKETPGLRGMGCTMVAAFITRGKLWWISVGDSHLYLLRDRELIKKNADHSYGGYIKRMREMGVDVAPDPSLSPNMLMSAMIGEEIAEIDLSEEPLQLLPRDRILVASDGLDTLGQGAVIQYSAWSSGARECVSALLEAVEAANQPRQDNTTVIIIDAKERGVAAAPAPEPAGEKVKAPDLEATTEMTATEIAKAITSPEAPLAPAEPTEPTIRGEVPEAPPETPAAPAPGGGKGLLVAVAVVLLLIAAAGAWFFLGGSKPPPAVVVTPPAPPAVPATPQAPAATTPRAVPPATATKPVEAPPVATTKPAEAAPVATGPEVFRDRLKSGGEGPEMITIPAGHFEMGGRASALAPDERPRHKVTLGTFAMSIKEITFAEYDRFAKATRRPLPDSDGVDREDHPVVNVSWDDAYQYTRWLSKETGKTYRLPSEAEWEYAARAGSTNDFWWGNAVGKGRAHCFDCRSGLDPRTPTRVGYFKPNGFGLYDTAGNVLEWVYDCYHPNYKGAPDDGSVWEGGDCTRRVARGGSFSSASSALRSANREKFVSTQGYDNIGIRVIREP